MTTATSCSSSGKFRHMVENAFRRAAPLGIFYGVLMFLLFPLMYLITLFSVPPADYAAVNGGFLMGSVRFYGYSGAYTGGSGVLLALICAFMPIVFGSILFSYLHNKRATDVYHALPMRRESLFAANYLAGLTLLWAPLVLCFGVILMAGGFCTAILGNLYHPLAILGDLAGWMIVTAAIYTITCAVAVLAGNTFDTVMFSLAFCGMYPVILFFAKLVVEGELLGFNGWNGGLMDVGNMMALSPFTLMGYRLTRSTANETNFFEMMKVESFSFYFWAEIAWLLLTIGLYFGAVWLYKRRKSERAGRTTASSLLNIVVKYVVTFVFGVAFGLLLRATFDMRWMLTVGTVIGGAIAYTVFEAVAARGFKTFPRAFAQMGISVGLTVVFVSVVLTGCFGFETRVPALDAIESVTVNYNGRYGMRYFYDELGRSRYDLNDELALARGSVVLTSPESIAAVRELHLSTIDDLRGLGDQLSIEWERSANFGPTITYKLKNGRTLSRNYRQCSLETAQGLAALENDEQFERQTNPAFLLHAGELEGITVTNRLYLGEYFKALDTAGQKELLEALQQDILAERLEDSASGTYEAVGYLRLEAKRDALQAETMVPENTDLLITAQYTNTLAFLQANGLTDRMELDPEQITRAAVCRYSKNFSGVGDYTGVYAYADPYGGVVRSYDIMPDEEDSYYDGKYRGEWMLVTDPAQVGALYRAAKNIGPMALDEEGKSQTYQVYFEYGDEQKALCLIVDPSQMPAGLAESYEQWMGESWDGEVVTAQAVY
ncbi:hypothetical protein H8711_06735 [Clostridiaceae bacterium NSJ-31]|uniref:ABC-2 type transport system permease protein n=2 Tax=Ligaoa zhengdingensis TaxID=2763658 RepID=A0A926E0L8_9FIRM|nr:hypothetical protein [Ligaoa zhengdingensis]MBC8546630.1 hypothetical protein [Ligaoa zhengdingensis]